MKKLKIKGIKKEMSTTGTGASFTPGIGAQYATAKAFKKKKTEEGPNWSKLRQGQLGIAKTSPVSKQVDVSEPFTTLSPSIPNRKSKAIDYVKLFEKSIDQYLAGINSQEDKKYKKWNPVTDFTDSQANAGDNTGYDMDSQDAAAVSELAKFATKGNKLKVGDTDVDKGVKYTVTNIDKETGAIQWKIDYVPAYDTVYKEFEELRSTLNTLAVKTDDTTIDDLSDEIRNVFNRYRTHIRKNYPDEYKRFQTQENIDPKSQSKHKGKSAPFGSAYEPVREASGGVSRSILIKLIHDMGAQRFADIIADLRDENLQDQIVAAFGIYKDEEGSEFIKPDILREARYSQFKKESQFRTPTQQLHIAVREIRRKIDEMSKVVSFTERMRTELKSSNEGMTYLNRTRNAIQKINEKLQDLNNRIKGLTE